MCRVAHLVHFGDITHRVFVQRADQPHNVITSSGGFSRPGVIAMQRRTFVNLTGGAIAALAFDSLLLAAAQQGRTLVAYPDPAVEIVDPLFAKYKIERAAVERLCGDC